MLTKENQTKLLQSILETFPKSLPPQYDKLTFHKCNECDVVRDDFNGIKWWKAEYELISENFDKLPLFTSEAYHYYFPAYLLCSLDEANPLFHSTIRDFIIYGLKPSRQNIDFSVERRNLFSDKEREVIRNYLKYILNDEDAGYLFEDVEKALVLWK